LQYFNYAYTAAPSSADEYAKSISTISHYDGDDTYIGKYVFDTTNPLLTEIEVQDASDTPNGSFELVYDTDGRIASFSSFNSSGTKLWDYQFGYDYYGNRVTETLQDKEDQPDVADFFSVESFFVDLNRYFP
ncbi:hypothetical protein, partial [Oceanispirochaeta sp.]|uniref:hypothetical protein n=1 Tax=Oceanispirochaeta sp. TaxID=2035350 RepID=UPI00261E518F